MKLNLMAAFFCFSVLTGCEIQGPLGRLEEPQNFSNQAVCIGALTALPEPTWETGEKYRLWVTEAQRRGLDPKQCSNIRAGNVGRPVLADPLADAVTSKGPHVEIALIKEGGTFKVPVLINGTLPLNFTVDSGAAHVSIPADVVTTLVRTGTITNADFLGDRTYGLADGSTVKYKTFRIRQIKVGDRVIENVLGTMADVNGSLLLGQSFLSRFKRVSFDYSLGVLVLE